MTEEQQKQVEEWVDSLPPIKKNPLYTEEQVDVFIFNVLNSVLYQLASNEDKAKAWDNVYEYVNKRIAEVGK